MDVTVLNPKWQWFHFVTFILESKTSLLWVNRDFFLLCHGQQKAASVQQREASFRRRERTNCGHGERAGSPLVDFEEKQEQKNEVGSSERSRSYLPKKDE
ncbi:hypothetical protein Dimus_008208 [Dionaea muscipula]